MPKEETLMPDADRCVSHLIQAIQSGELQPGQRLGEESVARLLEMGRAPVRIAFERMVSAGLFERVHRSGTFVRQLDFAEYRDLLEVRALLEGHAARLAAQRAGDALLAKISATAKEVEKRIASAPTAADPGWGERQRLEIEFHLLVAETSGNQTLLQILSSQNLIRLCFVERKSRSPRLTEEEVQSVSHRMVAEAIASRDPDRAQETMRRHILAPFEALLRRSMPVH